MTNREILDSWKEIAAYLGRSIKTCRRWEHELGLPVHRLEDSPKARVFAYADELDQWVKSTRKSEKSQKRFILKINKLKIIVAIFVIGIISGTLWWLLRDKEAPSGAIESIAVLPFENLSGDPGQEYFADGMTEMLIANLGKIKTLKVISKTSVMQYKGTNKKSLPKISKELHVDGIVEGAVQQFENRVRVTAQLIHAHTDHHVWGDTFERDIRDILTLQSDLAVAIARKIQVQITEQERLRTDLHSIEPEAYRAYLKGLHAFQGHGDPGPCIPHLERAIEIDPGYAPAHAFLAILYVWQADSFPSMCSDLYKKAKISAMKAIELDSNLGQAYTALGSISFGEWEWASAEQEYRRGIELSPNNIIAHDEYRGYLTFMGRFDQAFDEINCILELEPLSKMYSRYPGWLYYWARRYDESITELKRLPELRETGGAHGEGAWPLPWLALNYVAVKNYKEALSACERLRTLIPLGKISFWDGIIAYVYGVSGHRAEAWKIIDHWTKRDDCVPIYMAYMFAGLGDRDQTFHWLKIGYEKRLPLMFILKVDPVFDFIRDGSSFQELLNRMNFPN